jgi:hypothetical protein
MSAPDEDDDPEGADLDPASEVDDEDGAPDAAREDEEEDDEEDDPDPTAPPASGGSPLPAHRIALRAVILGAVAGPCIAVAVLILLASRFRPEPADVAWALGYVSAGAGVCVALLVSSEGVAAHVRPTRRLLVLLTTAAGSYLLIAVTIVWFSGLSSGFGPEHAFNDVAQFLSLCLDNPRPAGAVSMIGLLTVGTIGASRVGALPGLAGWVPPVPLQAAYASLAGLLAFAALGLFGGQVQRNFGPSGLGIITLTPAVATLGLRLGERAEARVLAALARVRASTQ